MANENETENPAQPEETPETTETTEVTPEDTKPQENTPPTEETPETSEVPTEEPETPEPTEEEERAIQEVSRARQQADIQTVDPVGSLRKVNHDVRQFQLNLQANAPVEVSQEAFTKYFAGSKLLKSLAEGLSGITESMSESAGTVISRLTNIFGKKSDLYLLTEYAVRHDYFSIAKTVKLYNPQGLKSKWLPYATYLVELAEEVVTIDQDVLYPLGEFLAKAINQPSVLLNATGKSVISINKTDKQFEETQKRIQKLFSGSQKEFIFWGEAFDRNTDVSVFIEKLGLAKSTIDKVDPNVIKKQVDTITSRAKSLYEMFKNPTSGVMLSETQSKQLSRMLILAARYVELYSIVIQLIYEMERCVINTQRYIEDKRSGK